MASFTNWLGAGQWRLRPATIANLHGRLPAEWRVVGTGDFNGDGRDDVVVAARPTALFTNWLAQGNGRFASNDRQCVGRCVPSELACRWRRRLQRRRRDDICVAAATAACSPPGSATANGGFVSNDRQQLRRAPTSTGRSSAPATSTATAATTSCGGATDGAVHQLARRRPTAASSATIANSWCARSDQLAAIDGTGDFNGDGRDDIVWRSDNGAFTTWLGQPNGGFVSNDANSFGCIPDRWQVVETSATTTATDATTFCGATTTALFTNWLAQGNGSFVSNDANAFTNLTAAWHVQGPDTFWA